MKSQKGTVNKYKEEEVLWGVQLEAYKLLGHKKKTKKPL